MHSSRLFCDDKNIKRFRYFVFLSFKLKLTNMRVINILIFEGTIMHNFFRTNILFLNFEKDMSRSVEPQKNENRKKKNLWLL